MKKKKSLHLITFLGSLVAFAVPALALAQTLIDTNIPGTNATTTGGGGPGVFVANFYQFALIIGGVLAFGVIVYGGVKYMISGGNPSGQSDAKEWIESALLGLLLLAGAYFVLNVINPQLLNLTLPTLTSVSLQGGTTGGGTGNTNGAGTGGTVNTNGGGTGPSNGCAIISCAGDDGSD
jgi:hypothetical protein